MLNTVTTTPTVLLPGIQLLPNTDANSAALHVIYDHELFFHANKFAIC